MTYQRKRFYLTSRVAGANCSQGFEVLPELIQIIINAAMQAERQWYLRATPYQHTPERQGRSNGFKPKTISTRMGEITVDIPQVREGGFYPER